jgi:hypothetical protein
MSNHNKGEIKTWNEGKPNIVGSSGALGLIGGIAGRAVKMLNFANIRSAVKQYVGKGGATAQQSLRSSSIPKNPRLAAKAKGDMSYLSIAKADKSVSKLPKSSTKTTTQIFKETGVHTTKQFEHPNVSGYSKTTGKWVDL